MRVENGKKEKTKDYNVEEMGPRRDRETSERERRKLKI